MGLLPPWVRRMIPLYFWPDWINPQLKLVDICIDMMEDYRKNWREGEEDGTFMNFLETDYQAGRITKNDIVWSLHSLIGSVILNYFTNTPKNYSSGGAIESSVTARSIAINFARFPKWQKIVREKLKGNVSLRYGIFFT